MNPTQAGNARVPTPNAGEFDGPWDHDNNPATPPKRGRHRTYQINVELYSPAPAIANTSLAPGLDGQNYPGDRITGVGGVPLAAPYPPGFFDMDPTAVYPMPQLSYQWDSQYTQDPSFSPSGTVVMGALPNTLTLVKSAQLPTSGTISGRTDDRGFHEILFRGWHFYVGPAVAPTVTNPTSPSTEPPFTKTLFLSVGPDDATYFRGVQSSEATGGVDNGLLDGTFMMSNVQMTPLMLAAGLFTVSTGSPPQLQTGTATQPLPVQMDILPVMLPNGGSDAHNRMSIPQVRGFWPAESNKQAEWLYYGYADEAWKHLQQEWTWLQSPASTQERVFLWAEGTQSTTYTTWTLRYQRLDPTKKRGALIMQPGGDYWVPVILDGTNGNHGTLFGSEFVTSSDSTGPSSTYGYYIRGAHPSYTGLYYYSVNDSQPDRQAHLQGAGTMLGPYTSTYQSPGYYMRSLGRTASSVAMSADGTWCASVLPGPYSGTGSSNPKILLWRTDKQAIPAAITGKGYVTRLDGLQRAADGKLSVTLTDSACIFQLGGVTADGNPNDSTIPANQRVLLPDSLMFVDGGLLFLVEGQLDRVYGLSLADGDLSVVIINDSRTQVNGAGTGLSATTTGQYVPDQDYLRGSVGQVSIGVQFSFAGSKPADGATGPAHVAFVAGQNYFVGALTDIASTTYPRAGFAMQTNRNKSLYFLRFNTSGGDLNLTGSGLSDLTGNSSLIYGDLLGPGRPGEELDYLSVSDDGNYVAVVREVSATYDGGSSYTRHPTFHQGYYYAGSSYSASYGIASHDILLVSTAGTDMHSATAGTEHVLFIGTGSATTSSDPTMPSSPAYAAGKAHVSAIARRLEGVTFAANNRTLIFNYTGNDTYSPTYGSNVGSSTGRGPLNAGQTGTFGIGTDVSIALTFRTSTNGAINFTTTTSTNFRNNLTGLTGISAIDSTTGPWGQTSSAQNFWATFKSPDGNFLYYISDQIDSSLSPTTANRNFMVGFNTSGSSINGHAPFTAFITHPNTIGFEQFDCNAWNYEGRFAASPGGHFWNGRDASGILCVIASDASAGSGSPTDLEVYAMDTNLGTNLRALTSSVTTGTQNAINHLYLSANGNVLAGQVSRTTTASVSGRAVLNSNSYLFVVMNIHDVVYSGATANSFYVSQGMSHGATVAFVGDGTGAGPQAIVFSSGSASSSNTSWATRTLKAAPLVPGASPTTLDSKESHYIVADGGRLTSDDPNSGN
jgi:hypothetical protein